MRILTLLAGLASGATPEPLAPTLTAPTSAPEAGQSLSFALAAPAGSPVVIDGCEPLELERAEGPAWVSVATATCDVPKPATPVADKLTLSVPRPTPGTYRAVLTFGEGCVDGRPLALAACRQLGVVRSGPVTIP